MDCGRKVSSTEGQEVSEPGGCLLQDKQEWVLALKESIDNVNKLSKFFPLTNQEKEVLTAVSQQYQMRVTRYYLSLIKDQNDPLDPIKRQCFPSLEEILETPQDDIDPLGEEKTSPLPFLVHRYPDRVLLLVTSRCFMYCRHCTRKRLWQKHIPDPTLNDINAAVEYIRNNTNIREVIVSGGDPLTLSTERLDHILLLLYSLPNIEVIRIGTRAPVVIPQRVDRSLCAVLKRYDNLWMNLQFNHPREVTPEAINACRKLQKCGIPLSNQSVLLKGINDNAQVMAELCHKLQSIRVRPYYLFQCDPVVGAGHFRTSPMDGVKIIEKMRGYTGGLCVPTFVVDGIDGKGKVPLSPEYLVSHSPEGLTLRNYRNEVFFYEDPLNSKVKEEPNKQKVVRNIGIIFNLKKDSSNDLQEEYDEVATIESLRQEIEKFGFSVSLFEQNYGLEDKLRRNRPDFIINLAEGLGKSRSRESQAPAILESLDIPYSGSDALALGISLDKYLTRSVLAAAEIPIPQGFMVKNLKEVDALKDIFTQNKLFIVKPRWEGSSKGIFLNSLVDNFVDLRVRVNYILVNYSQPALVEEFLDNDEITVGVSGNDCPKLLGMMKIAPRSKGEEKFLYSLEIKRQWEEKVEYFPQQTISQNTQKLLEKYAILAYQVLELKDFARVDFRLDNKNLPRIIDINPLPGLSPRYSDLPILYRLNGKTYSELIKQLLVQSFQRYGLIWP